MAVVFGAGAAGVNAVGAAGVDAVGAVFGGVDAVGDVVSVCADAVGVGVAVVEGVDVHV